jgi:hypothetical protein
VGSDDTKDSDPVNGTVSNIVLALNQANTSVDAGFVQAVLALGNRVWYDTNNDGINGSSENGIKGITINLYLDSDNNNIPDGAAIATRTTDASGNYLFSSLAPGNYIVGAVLPAGYVSSSVNAADPDNNTDKDDNGVTLVGNEIRGLAITLSSLNENDGSSTKSNTNNTYDFGMLPDCNCINTSGNLLTNGSFESGTTGWTASGGSVSSGTGYVACGTKNGFNAASKGKLSTVYQDVTIAAGTTVTLSGYAGIHTAGLSCSPKVSLVFRSASGTVLGQTDVAVTRDVDATNGQLALYTITAKAPTGTAKVRVQTTTTCNTMKMDAFCLRIASVSARGGESDIPFASDVKDNNETETALRAAVSPNPAINYFNLDIRSDDHVAPVTVRVLNSFGAAVFNKKAQPNTTMRIDLLTWKSGVYFVEVTQGGKRRVEKLVKAIN